MFWCKRVSNDRNVNAVWHQARLGVLPLKAFLFEINKKITTAGNGKLKKQ
jgi:hypothetical protein